MIRNPYHPVGLIIRRGPNGQNRFAVADSVGGREVSHGYDWQAAYDHWLQTRRARVPVPHPLPLSWLLKEFAECRRMGDERMREAHARETRLIAIVLANLGDPPADGLRGEDCIAFRSACAATPRLGPVRTETLIRRIRQAWKWGREQGWLAHECPFAAEQRDSAIRQELVGIVASCVPDSLLSSILSARNAAGPPAEQQIKGLSCAVRQAARRASEQARRDGRPDLADWLARCKLSWFLDASIDESLLRSNALQSMVSGRIERMSKRREHRAKDAQ
jgi:hypothetical protein